MRHDVIGICAGGGAYKVRLCPDYSGDIRVAIVAAVPQRAHDCAADQESA